jgi:hypothetical protein
MDIGFGLRDNEACSANTGLTREEFKCLLIPFTQVIKKIEKEKQKSNPKGAGPKSKLRSPAEKLFFILFYLKTYIGYAVLVTIYGVDQSRPCRWVKELMPILEEALSYLNVLPARAVESEEDFRNKIFNSNEIFIDGTERPIQRSSNDKEQRKNYSGKKKRHTKKTLSSTTQIREFWY